MMTFKAISRLVLLGLIAMCLCSSISAYAVKMVDITFPSNEDPMYGDLESRQVGKNGIVLMNTTHYMREDTVNGLQGDIAGTALMSMGYDCERGDVYISNGVKQFDLSGKLIKTVAHDEYRKTINLKQVGDSKGKFATAFCTSHP